MIELLLVGDLKETFTVFAQMCSVFIICTDHETASFSGSFETLLRHLCVLVF